MQQHELDAAILVSVKERPHQPRVDLQNIQVGVAKACVELKALKMYLLAYRSLGIFYENAVNKILEDIVEAIQPEWCVIRGEFTPRGGLNTTVEVGDPRRRVGSRPTPEVGSSQVSPGNRANPKL